MAPSVPVRSDARRHRTPDIRSSPVSAWGRMPPCPPRPSRRTPLPHGKTARRLEWPFLPPHLRAWIERRCGSPVVSALTQNSGFTPGLRLGAGVRGRLAPLREGRVGQGPADVRRLLPRGGPQARRPPAGGPRAPPEVAPRRRLGGPRHRVRRRPHAAAAVGARGARRPPRRARGGRRRGSPRRRPGSPSRRAEADFAPLLEGWPAIRAARTDLDAAHLAEAEALARRYAEVVGGDTLVHTDIRSDNVLIDPDGRALVCDWNWPVRGAAWFDSLAALIAPRGEGIDVDAVIASRRLLRDVDAGGLRHQPRALRRLLLRPGRAARAADLAAPPRPPALAGRGVLGLAGRAPGLVVTAPRAVGVRIGYAAVPAAVRAWVDETLGSPVVATAEQVGGMSPGCATRVTCADGTRAFVKAVGAELNPDTPAPLPARGRPSSTTSASTSCGPACWRRTTTARGSRC